MRNGLVLTAAGASTRMGGATKKEYLTLETGGDGRISVLSSALHAFLSTHLFPYIVITVPAAGEAEARRVLAEDRRIGLLTEADGVRLAFTSGGSTRQESVRNGLTALALIMAPATGEKADETVLIHDAARPWVTPEIIIAVLDGVRSHGASVPAVQPVDTHKEIDADGKIVRHLERSRLAAVQTPQGFTLRRLLEAHERAASDGAVYTDDTEIWARYSGDVYVCEGSAANRKVTYQGDIR